MNTVAELIKGQQYAAAWSQLLEQGRRSTDYGEWAGLCRLGDRIVRAGARPTPRRAVRVGLLGGASTELLSGPLKLAVEMTGLGCDLYCGAYNTFAEEMLSPQSGVVQFKPDVVVIAITPANVPSWPVGGDDADRARQLADEVCDYWLGLCARLHAHAPCEVILNNFHPLSTRPLGCVGAKIAWEPSGFLRRVNVALGERAPAYVHINDVDALSHRHGLERWFDPRYWFHAKQPVALPCVVPYVRNTAQIIGALFGVTAKCLVVDLDNTLWGGVVGDDGLDGIRVGAGDAVGEAFAAFQDYLLKLQQRGVLLAVCSKNEEANAVAAFEKRREMVLKREHFVAFKANWRPKPDNIREIAAELNLGLDALVFVDDNPAEREHVRQELPQVKVIDLTTDPADYPRLVEDAGLLEITSLSIEDGRRTHQYRDNAERVRLQESTGDYAAYLATLDQRAVIRPFEAEHLDRITQLINKSNQFNLTTRRLTRSEVDELRRDPERLTVAVRLADRFGDNGLISVVSGRRAGGALAIDLWLMSCRVLKRGVEHLVCNHIVEAARAMGCTLVEGLYVPTEKNGLVREHYRSLGFASAGREEDGTTRWTLDVANYAPFDVAIVSVEDCESILTGR